MQSKRELAEQAFATPTRASAAPLITDAQRAELRARLAHHRAHPDEPGMTVAQLTAKLKAAAH